MNNSINILFFLILFFLFILSFFLLYNKQELNKKNVKEITINYGKESTIENLYLLGKDFEIDRKKIIEKVEKACPEYLSEKAKNDCILEFVNKIKIKIKNFRNSFKEDINSFLVEIYFLKSKLNNKYVNNKEEFYKNYLNNLNINSDERIKTSYKTCESDANLYFTNNSFYVNLCNYIKLNEELNRLSLYYTVLLSVPAEEMALKEINTIEFKNLIKKIKVNKNKAYEGDY